MSNMALWFEYSAMARTALNRLLEEPRGSRFYQYYQNAYDEISQYRDKAREDYEAENKLMWNQTKYTTDQERANMKKLDDTYTVRRGPGRPRKT